MFTVYKEEDGSINENLETKEIISCAEYIKGKNIILCSKQQITEYIESKRMATL